MRKVIQISGGVALCDDETKGMQGQWLQLDNVPQPENEEPNKNVKTPEVYFGY